MVLIELSSNFDPSLRIQIHFGRQHHWVLGDEAIAAALLTSNVRQAFGPGDQIHIVDGRISLLSKDLPGAGIALVAMDEIAGRLSATASVRAHLPALLSETAFTDRDPRARAHAAQHLADFEPSQALRAANDPSPEVRLSLAKALGGATGFDLASEILLSNPADVRTQQTALRFLITTYSSERVGPVLIEALSSNDERLLDSLVQAIAALNYRAALPHLLTLLPKTSPRNASQIATTLEKLLGADAEPTLLSLLDRIHPSGPTIPEEAHLVATAADILGRIGSPLSLRTLQRLKASCLPNSDAGLALGMSVDLLFTRYELSPQPGALALSSQTGALSFPGDLS